MPDVSQLIGRTEGRTPEDAPHVGEPVAIAHEARATTGAAMPVVDADNDVVRPVASRAGVPYAAVVAEDGSVAADVGTEDLAAPAALDVLAVGGRANAAAPTPDEGDYAIFSFDLLSRLRVVIANSSLQFMRSDKDANFTTAIADGNQETEDLVGLASSLGVVESLSLTTEDNLGWEVHFWGTDGFDDADLDAERWLGMVQFAQGDGVEITGAAGTTYRYSAHNLGLAYQDADGTNELHVSLVPRGGAKGAGAAGEVVLTVGFRANT